MPRAGPSNPARNGAFAPYFDRCIAGFFASLKGLRHEIHSVWTVDGDVVITEMTVHYERLDGQQISLPCANIFRLRDGLIADYRIFMDVAPLFAE